MVSHTCVHDSTSQSVAFAQNIDDGQHPLYSLIDQQQQQQQRYIDLVLRCPYDFPVGSRVVKVTATEEPLNEVLLLDRGGGTISTPIEVKLAAAYVRKVEALYIVN